MNEQAQHKQGWSKGRGRHPGLTLGLVTGLLLAIPDLLAGPDNTPAGMIQAAVLDAGKPLFIPTHPRVTTTLRFPGPIGCPEGRGFTEDEGKVPGEYLVSWTRGENHLTVIPLVGAGPLNLNVPYAGETYVLYFYPVERQFQALACLRLGVERGEQAKGPQTRRAAPASKADDAHCVGLMDKLRLLRVMAPGKSRNALAEQMGLELHIPTKGTSPAGSAARDTGGELECRVTLVARAPETGLYAFSVLLRNPGSAAVSLEPGPCLARTGSLQLRERLRELPAIIAAGESVELLLVAEGDPLEPAAVANDWSIALPPVLRAQGQGAPPP